MRRLFKLSVQQLNTILRFIAPHTCLSPRFTSSRCALKDIEVAHFNKNDAFSHLSTFIISNAFITPTSTTKAKAKCLFSHFTTYC
ncbi:hypothetical protein GCWU000325_00904 [Alloprevotella tannerae ATCC 51259]|uniref:Uncharacterized protein n=1 Tax=Alloprevotella tannerae ATCC 51259 TaxID=626522 RepID=C9LFC2_9BACT|nr:hypothetical protein GCWU000325_00904 [Alloprevotella tannerae ATCC 51259]